jgi:hypothetical protein
MRVQWMNSLFFVDPMQLIPADEHVHDSVVSAWEEFPVSGIPELSRVEPTCDTKAPATAGARNPRALAATVAQFGRLRVDEMVHTSVDGS